MVTICLPFMCLTHRYVKGTRKCWVVLLITMIWAVDQFQSENVLRTRKRREMQCLWSGGASIPGRDWMCFHDNFLWCKMQIISTALLPYQIVVWVKRHFERHFVGSEVPYMHAVAFLWLRQCMVTAKGGRVSSKVRASSTWRDMGNFKSMLGEDISRR